MIVNRKLLADGRGFPSQLPLPERITQYCAGGTTAPFVIGSVEHSSQDGANTQRVEEIAAHPKAAYQVDLTPRSQIEVVRGPCEDGGKGLMIVPDLLPNRIGERGVPVEKASHAALPVGQLYLRELLWTIHRKQAQTNRTHQLEDRRVGANTQRERQKRNRRKTGTAAQLAQAVADVLQGVLDIVQSAHVAAFLFDLFDATQLAQG